jgi:FtsP/CotA-like multicopper oxidase with cupredoxin domain
MHKKARPAYMSRRKFIALSVGTLASLSLPSILASCAPTPAPTRTPGATTPPASSTLFPPTSTPGSTPTPTAAPGANIVQPKVISSNSNRVLDTALVVKMKEHTLPGQTTPIQMRTYGSPKAGVSTPNPDNDTDWDWSFPGPTLRIKPLDTVKIKLYNRLPVEDNPGECNPITIPATATAAPAGTATPTAFPTPAYPECFHADNVTNLHFHGFHVDQGRRPDGKYGDDVLLALYPQGQEHVHEEKGINNEIGEVDFEFFVPDSQARGTFWYHPHSHGSTDLQVTNGMAGAFIVEDDLNDLFPGAKPAEYVLVIQDIAASVNFATGGNKPVALINGQITPNIPMKAGEVQRWRLINATGKGSNVYNISFDGTGQAPEIYLISADGIFIDTDTWNNEDPVDSIYLAPGNRIDFLVKAIDQGNFSLNATSVLVQSPGPGGGNGQNKPTPTKPADAPPAVSLVSTTVSGVQTPAMELPETLPALIPAQRPIPDSEIVNKEPIFVRFSVVDGKGPGQAPIFQIDGKSFDPCFVDHCMVVDTAEEWTITNSTTVAHPFHIHLNPFFIKEFYDPQGGLPDPGRRWQDTIIIPPASADGQTPGHVVIRHRFPEIVDKFVIHCHILGHEDRGMMQVVQVVAKAEDCTAPICK